MAVEYTYSIANDVTAGAVEGSLLQAEIAASAIVTGIAYINTNGDALQIFMDDTLSAGDKTLLDGLVLAHDPTGFTFGENFYEMELNARRNKVRETWFARDVGGTLTYKVREITYTWALNVLTQEVHKTFDIFGSELTSVTYAWETEGLLRRRRKQ